MRAVTVIGSAVDVLKCFLLQRICRLVRQFRNRIDGLNDVVGAGDELGTLFDQVICALAARIAEIE